MKSNWNYEKCVQVLTGEIELLRKISAAQDRVRQAVMRREWTDFDEKAGGVGIFEAEFNLLEKEREELFAALGSDLPCPAGEKPFYALVSQLPAEQSRELSRLYRELKMESLKVKALGETFLAYLSEAKTMAAAYLEAVCPARGGKLYTRKGSRVSQDLRSIVINNSF